MSECSRPSPYMDLPGQPTCDIDEYPDVGIHLSDGCRLSARIWRPVNTSFHKQVPVILEYLPYRKRDGTTYRDELTHPYFAKRGYASVRVDMRGNGDSEGLMMDEYSQQELDDAVEVIGWLASQDWCSGSVGMMGISWGGFNSLQVAAMQPPALKAIITLCSTADRFADDIHYKGGCLLNENFGWGCTMWSYSSQPPDPLIVGDDAWRDMWLQRLRAEPFLPAVWLEHQTRDSYWAHGSICEDYTAIKAATLSIGGWGDAYKNTVSNLISNIKEAPVKGIVGPWVHKYPHIAVPEPRIGFLQEALRWWDQWLKQIDRGVQDDPQYTVYLMNGERPKAYYAKRDGHWIAEIDWPRRLQHQMWHLQKSQCLRQRSSTTSLEAADIDEGDINALVSSPQTCGLSSGEYCAIWLGPEMPADQRSDDALSACFTSEPLHEAMDVVGAPVLKLTLRADKPAAQIAVRLNHVHPDGASTRITYGVMNLCHIEGHDRVRQIIPGEDMQVIVALDQIAYRVPQGHQIRIAISSTYWPLLWPMPEVATLSIIAGEVDLPLRPKSSGKGDDADERTFPYPTNEETGWVTESLRESKNSRKFIHDMNSGVVTLEIVDDFGQVRDCDHGLISGSVGREKWSIHPDDPLSARAEAHWTSEHGRLEGDEGGKGDVRKDGNGVCGGKEGVKGWNIRTEAYATMTSDKHNFLLTARLEAYENDILVFKKEEEKTIPRSCR